MPRFLLYLCLLTLTQCSKCKDDPKPKAPEPEPSLPAATHTGAHTFGFRLNNQVWLPVGGTFTGRNLSASLYQGTMLINVSRVTTTEEQYLNLRLSDVYNNPHFVLDAPTTAPTGNYVHYADDISHCEYESDNGPVGEVDITNFDGAARIISGRFHFSLRKPGCPDIEATDGRFDLKF